MPKSLNKIDNNKKTGFIFCATRKNNDSNTYIMFWGIVVAASNRPGFSRDRSGNCTMVTLVAMVTLVDLTTVVGMNDLATRW